jgi:hypothetical protein
MQQGVMAAMAAMVMGLALCVGASGLALAQQSSVKTVAATAAPKAGKGEKVCRVKLNPPARSTPGCASRKSPVACGTRSIM